MNEALFVFFAGANVIYIPQDPPLLIHLPTSSWPMTDIIANRGGTWFGFERAITRAEDEHTTIVPATRLKHKIGSRPATFCLTWFPNLISVTSQSSYESFKVDFFITILICKLGKIDKLPYRINMWEFYRWYEYKYQIWTYLVTECGFHLPESVRFWIQKFWIKRPWQRSGSWETERCYGRRYCVVIAWLKYYSLYTIKQMYIDVLDLNSKHSILWTNTYYGIKKRKIILQNI